MNLRLSRFGAALAGLLLLEACARIIPETRPPVQHPPRPVPTTPAPPPKPVVTAIDVGVFRGPDVASFAISDGGAQAALASFRESCPRLLGRNDTSGLTQRGDWQDVCAAAANWPTNDAARFFRSRFELARVSDGSTYVTGYYEPEIAGSRTHIPGYDVPVYGVPRDLVHARAGDAPIKPNGQTPFGRYDDYGVFQPYFERGEIDDGKLLGKGLEIGWAADPVEFFFLQIQGSGRLRGPDGTVMRIGYAADNGQNYTGIGTVMRQQGLLGNAPGQYAGSMQGIMQYIREHPQDGMSLMRQNKSWVFFRELTGDGPIGAMGVPVRPHVSVAADPLFTPLGAPVLIEADPALANAGKVNGLWVAQDTGGAIKGANRFDSFWGAGDEARRIAGGMLARGRAYILLPKGTLARLGVR
jgi:membrane-bound lytic murein transglycosylase A